MDTGFESKSVLNKIINYHITHSITTNTINISVKNFTYLFDNYYNTISHSSRYKTLRNTF